MPTTTLKNHQQQLCICYSQVALPLTLGNILHLFSLFLLDTIISPFLFFLQYHSLPPILRSFVDITLPLCFLDHTIPLWHQWQRETISPFDNTCTRLFRKHQQETSQAPLLFSIQFSLLHTLHCSLSLFFLLFICTLFTLPLLFSSLPLTSTRYAPLDCTKKEHYYLPPWEVAFNISPRPRMYLEMLPRKM